MDEQLLNRIISVAYKDATFLEKIKIYKLANKNPEVKATLNEYKTVAVQTHKIDLDLCPDEVVQNSKKISKMKPIKENSLIFDIYSFIFGKPAVSFAILSLFVLALASTFIFTRIEIHQQYSKQEIELADKQVKHSLALIGEVFKKTTKTVEEDVLAYRVSKPIKESLNLIDNYLQGDKNENIN